MKRLIILFCGITLLSLLSFKMKTPPDLLPSIASYLTVVEKDFDKIPAERKENLEEVVVFLNTKLAAEKKADLVFICTHNSRRSHMAQLWAYAAAAYYGIEGVTNFSGGTENTAFNERAVQALKKTGFDITKVSEETNPRYEVRYADNAPPLRHFLKSIWMHLIQNPDLPQS